MNSNGHDTGSNPPELYCDGKVKLTRRVAVEVCKFRARKSARRHPYKCAKCHGWHVGSSIMPRAARQRRGDELLEVA